MLARILLEKPIRTAQKQKAQPHKTAQNRTKHIKGNDINNYADLKKLLKIPTKPKTELELILELASKLEIEGSDNMDTLLKLIVCIKENAQTIKGDHIKTLQVQLKNAKAIKVA